MPVLVGINDPLPGSSSGIVQVLAQNGSGTGELLSSGRDVLTAAHVVTDSTGALLPGNLQIVFQLPQVVKFTVPSTAITVHPGWTGDPQLGNDLAIISLPAPAPPSAVSYPLYTASDEPTQTFTLDGFGQTGIGAEGTTTPGFFTSAGTLRSAQNRYDGTDAVFAGAPVNPIPPNTPLPKPGFPAGSALIYDFDDGMAAHDALGFFYGINNTGLGGAEGSAAPGDSGGAGFIGNAIASIASYEFGFPGNPDVLPGTNASFGEIVVDTRVSAFAGWINSVINANRLQVTLPAAVTAGMPFAFTVTAVNALGMVVPGYLGTVRFTTSDPAGALAGVDLPADYTFVAGDNGRHTFPVAGTETTLITGGVLFDQLGRPVPVTQSITATDTAMATVTGYGTTVVNAAATDHFDLTPFDQTANPSPLPTLDVGPPPVVGPAGTGVPVPILVQARDRFGNTNPNYGGTVRITSTDPAATLPPNAMFMGQDAGSKFFNVTFNTVGDRTVTATDVAVAAITGDIRVRVVASGTAVRLRVTTPTTVTAGAGFVTTVQALDVFGGIATTYRGTIHFTSNDTNAAVVLPADYPFVAGDNGTHAFPGVVLATAGLIRDPVTNLPNPNAPFIVPTDTVNARISGGTLLNVVPDVTARLLVVPASPNVVANMPFGVTVTAQDRFRNTTPGYRGRIHFTTNDPAAAGVVVPADYTFVAGDNGAHAFPAGVTLVSAGARTITATDTAVAAINGTGAVTVGAPVLARFLVVASVNPVTAGLAFMVTVTAQDALGNTVTGYRGTVHFTSSDMAAGVMLPADYPFVAGDNGVHVFNGVVLVTDGRQLPGALARPMETITVTDVAAAAVMGQAAVVVNPAVASTLSVTPAANLVLRGVPTALTVTARDRFGNIATGYRGTVGFVSTDGAATRPPNTAFTATDRGVHTFFGASALTLRTLGAQTVTATDNADATITGMGALRVVAPAAVASLRLSVFTRRPSTLGPAVLTGRGFTFSVSALDANGFVTPAYTGTIRFSTTDMAQGVVLPPNYTFLAGDLGTKTFAATLITVPRNRAGIAELRARDTANAALTGAELVPVVRP
jgi:hypothetical protein